jgi:hypothetical protein
MSLMASILAATEGAADPSKTPFYVFGGLLAGWAVLVALLGIAKPDLPARAATQGAIMFLTVALVAGAMTTAVLTA